MATSPWPVRRRSWLCRTMAPSPGRASRWSVCGACPVLMDGRSVRACLLFAVQAEGHGLLTVEGLAPHDGQLHPIQQAFHDKHALQCGFCTPGFLMSAFELLDANPDPTEDEVRGWLSGNLCRCTAYQNIVDAVLLAAEPM